MTMDFGYKIGGSLERITFQGLNGREPARNLKNALELLRIENPMCTFHNRVKTGEFDSILDDDYRQLVDTMKFIASLWRYPDAKEGEDTVSEMNVLMLLANAIETGSRLSSAGRDCGESRPPAVLDLEALRKINSNIRKHMV